MGGAELARNIIKFNVLVYGLERRARCCILRTLEPRYLLCGSDRAEPQRDLPLFPSKLTLYYQSNAILRCSTEGLAVIPSNIVTWTTAHYFEEENLISKNFRI